MAVITYGELQIVEIPPHFPNELYRQLNDELRHVMYAARCKGMGCAGMLQAAFACVQFGGLLLLATARIAVEDDHTDSSGSFLRVRGTFQVPHRDDPSNSITVQQVTAVHCTEGELLVSPLLIVQRYVRDLLAGLLLHELDEGIRVLGRLAWDPHLRAPAR